MPWPHLRVAAGARVADVGVDADDLATERDGQVLVGGVAADERVVLREVDRVVVPLLEGDDGEVRALARDDGDELRVLPGARVLEQDGRPRVAPGTDDEVALRRRAGALENDPDRLGQLGLDGDVEEQRALRGAGEGGGAVLRGQDAERAGVVAGDLREGHALRELGAPLQGVTGRRLEESRELLHRGEAPLLLAPLGHGEGGGVERGGPLRAGPVRHEGRGGVRVRCGARPGRGGRRAVGQKAHQPTAPSIWSSMRRLSSSAYSMGSSRAMGSMKPRTIMAIASSSAMPRDMR